MRVDIWSDVVCPWCYIGKRQFEQGLAGFAGREQVEVVYHAFELDPSIPAGQGTPIMELLAAKYGLTPQQAADAEAAVAARAAAAGLSFTGERLMGNTFNAHRLVRLGLDRGIQDQVLQHLYEAYFGRAQPVFTAADLTGLAAAAGLDPAEAGEVLAGDRFADAVRADEAQAAKFGINGVPFAVVAGRYGVSGAQAPETFTAVLERAERDGPAGPAS